MSSRSGSGEIEKALGESGHEHGDVPREKSPFVFECLALPGGLGLELSHAPPELRGFEGKSHHLERDGVLQSAAEAGKLAPGGDEPRLDEVVPHELLESSLEGREVIAFAAVSDPADLASREGRTGGEAPELFVAAELRCDRVRDEAADLVAFRALRGDRSC